LSSSIPLTHAVQSGDESAVSALLANGADANESTSGGQTALILAVIFGHTNLVQLLVKAGADPQLRDNLGLNAIEWAQRRGLTEALDILTGTKPASATPSRTTIKIEEPEKVVTEPPPTERGADEGEKSRRWVAGLKQRLDEQEQRRLNRNEPPPAPQPVAGEPPPLEAPHTPVIEPPLVQRIAAPEIVKPEPATKPAHSTGRVITPPPAVSTPAKRKRCPQCNAIYSDMVAYCAHHIVPLVDADEPIISEPPKMNASLFWILVLITLTGSIVVGTLVTTYLYKSNRDAAAAAQQGIVQKGTPELSAELVGKAVSLPEAQAPVNGPEPQSGIVIVRVMVDAKGQVYWARGSGGDWLMRGAATEAAMKSTFSPEKLRGRETEGTITYTFTQ
jgi:hypothetical protein